MAAEEPVLEVPAWRGSQPVEVVGGVYWIVELDGPNAKIFDEHGAVQAKLQLPLMPLLQLAKATALANHLRMELASWRCEVESLLATPGLTVIRSREGGGPEDLKATLVLTVMRLLEENKKLRSDLQIRSGAGTEDDEAAEWKRFNSRSQDERLAELKQAVRDIKTRLEILALG